MNSPERMQEAMRFSVDVSNLQILESEDVSVGLVQCSQTCLGTTCSQTCGANSCRFSCEYTCGVTTKV
jgi:hypothetical protein